MPGVGGNSFLRSFLLGVWWGNKLRQTGYTFLKKFLEKGSNTLDQEIGPPTLKTWLRRWSKGTFTLQ